MTRSLRVLLAVMVTMTLAACSVDPISPPAPGANASLLVVGSTGASSTLSATETSTTCGSGDHVVSGNSTYIVAYTDLPLCAAPPLTDTMQVVAPKPDSLSLKLSFE